MQGVEKQKQKHFTETHQQLLTIFTDLIHVRIQTSGRHTYEDTCEICHLIKSNTDSPSGWLSFWKEICNFELDSYSVTLSECFLGGFVRQLRKLLVAKRKCKIYPRVYYTETYLLQ